MWMRPSRLVVADIGATHVACGVFATGRGGELVIEHCIIEPLEPNLNLESLWREGVARALAKIGQDSRFRGPLRVAVPGHLALTKFIKTPAIAQSKHSKIIQFEAAQNIPFPLDEVVWEHLILTEDDKDLEIMLAAVKTEAMLGLCAAVNSAGYTVSVATPSCLALRDAFRFNYPEIKESTLIMDVGARSTQLLFVEGERLFGRTLPFGGNAVTQCIADELGLEFAAAEKLKLELLSSDGTQLVQSLPWRAVHRAAEGFCVKLQAEIIRSALNARRHLSTADPTSLYLTGGGSQLEILPRSLTDKLKLPVHRLAPLRRVEASPLSDALCAIQSAALVFPLIGLASSLVLKNRRTANLLPPVIQNELAFRRRQPVVIAAALLIAVALIPPIQYFHRLTVAAKAQAMEIESQVRPLRELEKRNTALLQQIERARKSVAELQGVADKKTNWLRFLKDLQTRLVNVEDVWLESLSVVREPSPEVAAVSANSSAPLDLRLVLSGRLLDRNNPISKVSADSYERVKQLIASFSGSEFVASVEHEQFDNSQPGILRFDFSLVVRPQKPL